MDNSQNQPISPPPMPDANQSSLPPAPKAGKKAKPQAPNSPYTETLEKLGLNKNEAQIYELLLNTGPQGMKNILFHTKLKRGNAYYHLDSLIAKGLVEKQDLPKATTKFSAKHPEQLELLLAKQKAAIFAAGEELNKSLPDLRSLYQLAAIKPTIKFYEGLDGIKQVLEDSLTSKTDIYSYADIEAIIKYINSINTEYVNKREQLKLKKKGIFIDTPKTRQLLAGYHPTVTESRIIKYPATPFESIMQIYDNKTSYITLAPNKMVGVIIQDPLIYQMHKYLFEYTWSTARPVV